MAGFFNASPTAYPKAPFYLIRILQFVFASIVAGEMFYFISEIHDKGLQVPWVFYILHAAALLTLLSLLPTSILAYLHRLPILIQALLNFLSTSLWTTGFALFINARRETITFECSADVWGHGPKGMGVKLCHLYRLLFCAALMGVVVSLAALCLDVVVWRRTGVGAGRVGRYVRAEKGGAVLGGHLDLEIDTGYRSGSDSEGLLYDPHKGVKASRGPRMTV